MIKRLLKPVLLRMDAAPCNARRHRRVIKNRREVESLRLPMFNCGLGVEHIDAPDHLIDGSESHLRHVLANLLCNVEEEIDDVLGLSLELLAQNRILRRDANRAGIQMALAHHDAAHRDQRSRSESEFFGAEKSCNDNVA